MGVTAMRVKEVSRTRQNVKIRKQPRVTANLTASALSAAASRQSAGLQFATRDRKTAKRTFRQLWNAHQRSRSPKRHHVPVFIARP